MIYKFPPSMNLAQLNEHLQKFPHPERYPVLHLHDRGIEALSPLLNHFSSLRRLLLNDNKIKDIALLATLSTSLQVLNLSNNEIVDITPLKNLPKTLETLYLNQNQIVDIKPLKNLPDSFEKLILYQNQIVDIAPLSKLPATLEHLNLNCNRIVDFSPLKNLPESLKELEIKDNNTHDYSPVLAQIPFRYKLCLNATTYEEDDPIEHIIEDLEEDNNRMLRATLFALVQTKNRRVFRRSALNKLPLEIDFPLFRLVSEHLVFLSN